MDGSAPPDGPSRRVGRPCYLDAAKAERARTLLLAGRRPGYVRKRTGLSYHGVMVVIQRIKEERRDAQAVERALAGDHRDLPADGVGQEN